MILNNKSTFNNKTDLLLYLAARSENIDLVKKHFGKKIILIDRFTDSTVAYQHYGMGVSKEIIDRINKFLLRKIKISYTFLNIVNKKNMRERLIKRKKLNRYDKFSSAFYQKVQKGFLKILNRNPKKYMIINSNFNIKDNKMIILKKIDNLI